jgi:hypothetical protein
MAIEPNAHVQSIVAGALEATANATEPVKAAAAGAAATAAANAIPAPSGLTTNILWTILVSSLGLVLIGSVIFGGIYVLQNKASPPDILTTIFSTSLSGLLGLFVKSPSSQ